MDSPADDYALLDAGDGRRLERFGGFVLDRPAPGAREPRRDPAAWAGATARYERPPGGGPGRWTPDGALPGRWTIRCGGLPMELRPTPAGQVGVFPEHRAVARWAADRAAALGASLGRPVEALNLFAHTGLATLALAAAGARVAHVDASRPAVAWARRNAELAGLAGAPVRWLVDDAGRFAGRERRRGRTYEGILLDPPTYGHGPDGAAWRLAEDLGALLEEIRALLAAGPWFVACSAHATGLPARALADAVRAGLGGGAVEVRRLSLGRPGGPGLDLGWAVLVDGDGARPA